VIAEVHAGEVDDGVALRHLDLLSHAGRVALQEDPPEG
jgi:hypothetical protein